MRLLCLVYLYEHYMLILPYLQDPAKLVFVDLLFEYLFIYLSIYSLLQNILIPGGVL